MKRITVAMIAAQSAAVHRVSLESHLEQLDINTASLESQLEEIDNLTQLATGLESVVASLESHSEPSLNQHRLARRQVVSFLSMSGLSSEDIRDIIPSLEAANAKSGWEKFKAFLLKLWELIKAAAIKIYTFIDNVLKSSTVAEKAAILRLRDLRKRIGVRGSSMSVKAKLPLRPAHGYLCTVGHASGSAEVIYPKNYADAVRAVTVWKRGRDVIQTKLPEVLKRVSKDLKAAIDALALKGTDEEVTQSIRNNRDKIYDAIDPMFGGNLKTHLGLGVYIEKDMFPLIFDRILRFHGVSDANEGREYEELSSGDRDALLASYGVSVEQLDLGDAFKDDRFFEAMTPANITALLATCESLIDSGHSADQARSWSRLRGNLTVYGGAVEAVLKSVLKRENLGQDERSVITFALHASRAMAKWAAAPYAQINTVNLRVVNSLLAMAEDQIKNLDVTDDEVVKAKKDDKSKKAKDDDNEHVESIRNRD